VAAESAFAAEVSESAATSGATENLITGQRRLNEIHGAAGNEDASTLRAATVAAVSSFARVTTIAAVAPFGATATVAAGASVGGWRSRGCAGKGIGRVEPSRVAAETTLTGITTDAAMSTSAAALTSTAAATRAPGTGRGRVGGDRGVANG
jgi:hypothetical protein